MSHETTRDPSKKRKDSEQAAGWKVLGLLLGAVVTLVGVGMVVVNAVQGVHATGLIGVRGTYTVEACHQTGGNKAPDYECYGDFDPVADGYAGIRKLENAEDYPTGRKFEAVESPVGSSNALRETGIGATLLSVVWLFLGLIILLMGFLTTRKWARSFRK